MKTTTWMFLAAGLLAMTGVACGGGKRASGTGLSVSAHSSASSSRAGPGGITLADGVTISRIRMAVQRISVEGMDPDGACSTAAPPATSPMASHDGGPDRSGGSGGSGDDRGSSRSGDDDDDCELELSFGPFDVDLAGTALGGAVQFAFDAPIPAGTYEELAIRVNTVPASRAGDNQVLQDLAAAHASILVDGFVTDATSTISPFTFSTPMEVTQKREGSITIGPGSNVTLDFDPTHWFDGASGRLDPTAPENQGAILANIRASIRILKDDDHDGRDDDSDGPGHR